MSYSHVFIIGLKSNFRCYKFLYFLLRTRFKNFRIFLSFLFSFSNHYKSSSAIEYSLLFYIYWYFNTWASNICYISWKTTLFRSFNWGEKINFINSSRDKVIIDFFISLLSRHTISICYITSNIIHYLNNPSYPYTGCVKSDKFLT